jgi:NADH-quinone oxidoreductase subunit C
MVYHLYSFNYLRRPTGVALRVDLERPDFPDYPIVPSLTSLWPGANFQEREVYDLMGVKFVGHPDLRRILLSDDFPGHPLRKDFVFDYEYVLVRHLSYGVEGQLATEDRGPRSLY